MKNRYIGDRAFYQRVFAIAIPMIIQNGITNFVSLLDNIMVGQIGTIPMTGVSIVNQLLFVFNLCIFGANSGAGIFTAQYQGSGDQEGVRITFRFKVLISLLISVVAGVLFYVGGPSLIGLYLTGEGDPADAALALSYGMDYVVVMIVGLLPFALCNAYSSTLRETGESFVPMVAGVTAVFVNLILNYVLIFGHFGAPVMGVKGAALATVISRFAELFIVAVWTHRNSHKVPFIQGVYRTLRIPLGILKNICIKGLPLLVNELMWSVGVVILNQSYSTCGLDVVPAINISSTLSNLASVAYLSIGSSVGIIMGQLLGAQTPEDQVRDANRKLIAVSVASSVLFALVMASLSRLFPRIYSTTDAVRSLAATIILITAAMMPFHAFTHAVYFTLRSGGQTFITFLFDSCYMWVFSVPLAFCLSRFTSLPILPLYILCQLPDMIKCLIGYLFLRKSTWIRNLT